MGRVGATWAAFGLAAIATIGAIGLAWTGHTVPSELWLIAGVGSGAGAGALVPGPVGAGVVSTSPSTASAPSATPGPGPG
jgi:hypothetical protein